MSRVWLGFLSNRRRSSVDDKGAVLFSTVPHTATKVGRGGVENEAASPWAARALIVTRLIDAERKKKATSSFRQYTSALRELKLEKVLCNISNKWKGGVI